MKLNATNTFEVLSGVVNFLSVYPNTRDIFSYMNESMNPCNNFYQFSCGNFLRNENTSNLDWTLDNGEILEADVEEQFKALFLTDRSNKNEAKYLSFPNKIYKSCMNTSYIQEGGDRLMQEIAESVGGWPVVKGDDWDKNGTWNWLDTEIKLVKLGFNPYDFFMGIQLEYDFTNETKGIMNIMCPFFLLPDSYYTGTIENNTYLSHIFKEYVDLSVKFGAERQFAEAEFKKVINLTQQLVMASTAGNPYRHQKDHNTTTVEELQREYPFIHWTKYLSTFWPEKMEKNLNFSKDVKIIMTCPEYYEKLGEILKSTPKRILANYILLGPHRRSQNLLLRRYSVLEDWESMCMKSSKSLPEAFYSLYLKNFFNTNMENDVDEISKNIRRELSESLSEWMDEATKQQAIEKLNKMKVIIGSIEEYLDENKIAEFYDGFTIEDGETYLNISLKIAFFHLRRSLTPFMEYTRRHESRPPTVPFIKYSPDSNSLIISAASLQGNNYNFNRSKYLNYGTIGYWIGKEMIRGLVTVKKNRFETTGKFPKWWSNDSAIEFENRMKCLNQQLNNSAEKLNDNSEDDKIYVLHENELVIEKSAVKIAYNAYKKWTELNGKEKQLEGVKYTPEQLFWISYAQKHCSKINTQNENILVFSPFANHPTHEEEVLINLKNIANFSLDFNCPIGSEMNPAKKC